MAKFTTILDARRYASDGLSGSEYSGDQLDRAIDAYADLLWDHNDGKCTCDGQCLLDEMNYELFWEWLDEQVAL